MIRVLPIRKRRSWWSRFCNRKHYPLRRNDYAIPHLHRPPHDFRDYYLLGYLDNVIGDWGPRFADFSPMSGMISGPAPVDQMIYIRVVHNIVSILRRSTREVEPQ